MKTFLSYLFVLSLFALVVYFVAPLVFGWTAPQILLWLPSFGLVFSYCILTSTKPTHND